MDRFTVNECYDTDVVKKLFEEYSQIKGAESCFGLWMERDALFSEHVKTTAQREGMPIFEGYMTSGL